MSYFAAPAGPPPAIPPPPPPPPPGAFGTPSPSPAQKSPAGPKAKTPGI